MDTRKIEPLLREDIESFTGVKGEIHQGKKVLIVGCHVGINPKVEAVISALEATHNCKVEIVNLVDSEKEELKALATNLVVMRCKEVRESLDMQLTSCHSELVDAGKSYHNYQKTNSQQGWKNRPKHKR